MKDPIIIGRINTSMENEELKQKFPVGKLYQINFGHHSRTFVAYVNDKHRVFNCKEDIFLLLNINVFDNCTGYLKLDVLFSNGERGEIYYILKENLKLIQ